MQFVDGLDTTIAAPQEMTILLVEATRTVWTQQAGERAEPLRHAFCRLFGRDLPAPVLISAIYHEGRWKTVNTLPGGIVLVWDNARGGWEIRTFSPETKAAILRAANAADALKRKGYHRSPLTLTGADGRIGDAGLRSIRSVPV